MTDDKKKAFKKNVIESPNKANGLLQQSLLEIAQLTKYVDTLGQCRLRIKSGSKWLLH
jgi:hypothetical protein